MSKTIHTTKIQFDTAEVFEPLLAPARYKGCWGGRGSGKSHFFVELLLDDHIRNPGMRSVCIREVQKSLKQSSKRLIEDKLQAYGLGEAQGFKVLREHIETPGGGIIIFMGMQDHTADSIKSLEGFDRAWIEEAQSISHRSLELLTPTIRKEGSEIWASWNPSRPTDAIDQLLRGENTPEGAIVVRANWSDNPWLSKVLLQEKDDCFRMTPDRYPHVWEGEYATVLEGAYYAQALSTAALEQRIGFFGRDPINKTYAFWDIGGTSSKSDATAIWVAQFIGEEVRVVDYYEAVGQPFDEHVGWMRSRGYENAVCILPHDGRKHDMVYKVTPETFLQDAGFITDTIPNQGAGAVMARIEATRRMFPSVRFHDENTKYGREALGWYHEKRDEARNMGLGPEHDWSSHGADAFGMIAIYRKGINTGSSWSTPLKRGLAGVA
jgi:phage terminase large subunit